MITVYELKNRPCCRCFCKAPYFIKNIVLLLILSLILVPIYFVHFRKESLGVTNIYKVLAGLNSQTFNYLQAHDEELGIKKQMRSLSWLGMKQIDFYTDYVAKSKPCLLPGLGRTWKAYNYWRYSQDGYSYLASQLEGLSVTVYNDDDPMFDPEYNEGYSFNEDDRVKMDYVRDFLPKMTDQAVGMTMRDTSAKLNVRLYDDITFPEFYHEIGDFLGMQFTQAQFFVDNAHYEKADQFLCVIDGAAMIRMVPHVNRQEMYVGEKYSFFHPNQNVENIVDLDANESPVNLFKPDYDDYPNVDLIHKDRIYKEYLSPGDCVFIPAFYFYQVAGEGEAQPANGTFRPAAIVASLFYKNNSELLGAFYDAIENHLLH